MDCLGEWFRNGGQLGVVKQAYLQGIFLSGFLAVSFENKSGTRTFVSPCAATISGGAEEDRTPDLMTASHALSQLSYAPLGTRIRMT